MEESEIKLPEGLVTPLEVPAPELEYFSRKWLWLTIAITVVYGGVLLYLIFKSDKPKEAKALPTPSPVAIATPVPVFKREDFKIQVLNGSGIGGLAGKAKTKLEALGYPEVAVGNADSKDYISTKLSIKKSKANFLADIKKDLSGYTLAQDTGTVTGDSEFDVEIILGSE
ncbi:LytR C-terminal domain-containing protein [Candidatus Amesbacteria bacterium]|nr:LytR C-terminal domain-containing protein [Candidatus Amesbacteria bacterium]